MAEITYVVNGIKKGPVILPYNEADTRNLVILPYITAYTLIEDTRLTRRILNK